MIVKIPEIFKTIGVPTVTYVERKEGRFETELSDYLKIPGKICLITGPSKTGKSTLYQKVIASNKKEPLIIRCDNEMSVEDVWRKALEEVNFERITSKSKSGELTISSTAKAGLELGWSWIGKLIGELAVGVSGKETNTKVRELILSRPSAKHIIPVLKNLPYILVIEDFHYLKDDVKISLFQQWKSFIDEEVSVIILGTTHHAVDIAYSNRDLVGRITHIEVGTWEKNDLKKIVLQGFKETGIELDDELTDLISSESVGLPLITQSICLRLFIDRQKLTFHKNQNASIDFSKTDVFTSLTNVAKTDFGIFNDIYEILVTGFRKRARKYNTYELLLLAFTIDPITFKLKRFEIDERFIKLKNKFKIPPAASINSTLGALSKLQKKNEFELLEWSTKQSTLYILEPSFLFYLRWKNEKKESEYSGRLFEELLKLFTKESNNQVSIKIRDINVNKNASS